MSDQEIPEAFLVRSPAWAGRLMYVLALMELIAVLVFDGSPMLIVASVFWVAFGWMTNGWRARITPNGISYTNPLGKDWSRPWGELQSVVIRRPSNLEPLVRARVGSGRRVRVNGGLVRTDTGAELMGVTVQKMIQAWADAGAAPSTPAEDDATD